MALFFELFLIGVGLAMDAFAVSVCKGLAMNKVNKKQAVVIGLYFGGFQALMPFIGWFLGVSFQKYITSIDHWIAFILLVFIGGKMILEAVKDPDIEEIREKDPPLDHKEMLMLAVATSIDALAVGISLAFLNTNIWLASSMIGVVTFAIATFGGMAGFRLGSAVGKNANIIGGLVLIAIGVKIVLEHTGFI